MVIMAGLFSPRIRELRGTLYQWEGPWVVDDQDFRTTFGAAPTPVDAAIDQTLEWFRSRSAQSAAVAPGATNAERP